MTTGGNGFDEETPEFAAMVGSFPVKSSAVQRKNTEVTEKQRAQRGVKNQAAFSVPSVSPWPL
jgi:hypothetical protein